MRLAILVFTSLLLSLPLPALAQETGEIFLVTGVAMSGEAGAWLFAGGGDRNITPTIGIGVEGGAFLTAGGLGVTPMVTIHVVESKKGRVSPFVSAGYTFLTFPHYRELYQGFTFTGGLSYFPRDSLGVRLEYGQMNLSRGPYDVRLHSVRAGVTLRY